MIVKSLFNLRLKSYLGNVPNKPSEVKITIFQPDECPESAFLPPTICGGQNDINGVFGLVEHPDFFKELFKCKFDFRFGWNV